MAGKGMVADHFAGSRFLEPLGRTLMGLQLWHKYPRGLSQVRDNLFQCTTILIQFSDPDIPETDRLALVAVRLQLNWRGVVCLVERLPDVQRLALQLEMILHQHAVKYNRDVSRTLQRAISIKRRSGPDDVVGLPLARLTIGVGERNALLVNAPRLAIDVSLVIVGIENLKLVPRIARPG